MTCRVPLLGQRPWQWLRKLRRLLAYACTAPARRFDDLIVLAEGQELYHGPAEEMVNWWVGQHSLTQQGETAVAVPLPKHGVRG